MAYHSDLKGHNTGGAKLLLADIRSGKLGFTLAGGPAYRFKTKCFCSVLPHSKKVKKKSLLIWQKHVQFSVSYPERALLR
jgi:hypothetical protein